MTIDSTRVLLAPVPKPLTDPKAKEREQRKRKQVLNRLVSYLTAHRARGYCEFCGRKAPDFRGLMGHHIIKLSQGGLDIAKNILIGCGICHDHTRYGTGTPLDVETQQRLVAELNEQYGITGELTGYDLDN